MVAASYLHPVLPGPLSLSMALTYPKRRLHRLGQLTSTTPLLPVDFGSNYKVTKHGIPSAHASFDLVTSGRQSRPMKQAHGHKVASKPRYMRVRGWLTS
ncbi:hypothetical protein B0J17DRAFT_439209 [Rhizoctonia solani]|nr:hypothetical protein B0J17DRAFT_439209 [Rhizoctonia solani]